TQAGHGAAGRAALPATAPLPGAPGRPAHFLPGVSGSGRPAPADDPAEPGGGRGGQVDGPRAMYRRRRRPAREIGFSFDSFLDVAATVVGIIIRLILVVWVGARSYSGVQALLHPSPPPAAARAGPHDPLEEELDRQRRELAEAQASLLEQLE